MNGREARLKMQLSFEFFVRICCFVLQEEYALLSACYP